MAEVDRRGAMAGALAMAGAAATPAAARAGDARRRTFRPGEAWLDTGGKPIQVRGGSILQVADTFYWYGENKERTTGKDKIWHWGMRMYSSKDLYNWTDLGNFIPPQPNDPSSPLHPFQFADRPHILYNAATKKFVCWIKFLADQYQTRTILTADRITGPYRIVATGLRPIGMGGGDFDLFVSPDDAKGYMAFERVHTEVIVADLTDDYTGLTGYYSTHLPRPGPPFTREGLAYFKRGARHYLASSGTTGYFPNPSEIAMADTFHGPWTTLGLLHRGDRTETSFNSQISSVFRHPAKKDLYIAVADRWMGPLSGEDFGSGALSRKVSKAFENKFIRNVSDAEDDAIMRRYGGLDIDTSRGRHVWLPIRFEGERPYIDWRDEWSLDEFE